MQCSRCGSTLFDASAYCSNCGALIEAQPVPATVGAEMPTEISVEQAQEASLAAPGLSSAEPYAAPLESAPVAVATPALPEPAATPAATAQAMPTPSFPAAPAAPAFPTPGNAGAYAVSGWAEFSGAQSPVPIAAPPGSGMYPAPGAYLPPPMVPGMYPNSYPNFAQPIIMQAPQRPRRRWPVFILGMIVGILITLVFGGVVASLRAAQAQPGGQNAGALVTAVPTPVVTPTSDPKQLYQRVTNQAPTLVDSLQNAATSNWSVFEKPLYGCEIKADGLHVHIKDLNHFTYCNSAGLFSNFAFQADMRMLTGDGGGLTFRGDATVGDMYYFHIFPDGNYTFYIEQNHKLATELSKGAVSSFQSGAGAKNTLTVIAQGTQMYLYVNQQFLTLIQSAAYTIGYLGLLASNFNAPAEIVYTNAKIWTL